MPPLTICRALPGDIPSLYRICHATGLNGGDASAHVRDPDLIGQVYVGPYAVLEPELAFVGVLAHTAVGYVVGTADTVRFHKESETRWFSELRRRYPLPPENDDSPTSTFLRALHRGHPPPHTFDLGAFPAHLHIDVLPVAQGQGLGRKLIDRFLAELRTRKIPGVHLYVATANPSAIQFYERIGFVRIDEGPGAIGYGYSLK